MDLSPMVAVFGVRGRRRSPLTTSKRLVAYVMGVAAVMLVGCVIATPYHHEEDSAEFNRDWSECRRENTVAGVYASPVYGTPGPQVDYGLAKACMRARGWRPGIH